MKQINFKKKKEDLLTANFVYIIGNGGSASTSNHMANDLMKLCNVKAISLCANEAVVMAYANDNGYENVFIDQLKVLLSPEDMLITISGSGTSPNIVKAKEFAKKSGCKVWSFPTMKDMNCNMQDIEDFHLFIVHQLVRTWND